jgi:cytoskeletal protein CcmA (bactofilin family)
MKATVTATEKVQLLKGAILIGEVHTPVLAIEEGAHFHGTSDMGADKWQEVETPAEAEKVHDLSAHRTKVRAFPDHTPNS